MNNIQYAIKQSIVAFFVLLTALDELLAESKLLSLTVVFPAVLPVVLPAVLQGNATVLNRSSRRWQQLDAQITALWKESPACS